ncbi:MAG: FprA family A-type flavoprotein [Fidelibacterota bacterium]
MNKPIQISGTTWWVGVNDRETDIFEALWPIPKGISYNAYLVIDEKVALIDTVKNCYTPLLLDKIRELVGAGKPVDYLIINHMEPDHSGAIEIIAQVYPEITIVGNAKTVEYLEGYYGIRQNVKVINDGDTLDLGEHRLSFHLTPMVHWPETMMTYDIQDQLLFSGDAFGGFGALTGGLFDDELNPAELEDETLRYYSNIVGKFSPMVQKAFEKLGSLEIKTVASTHGPVWRTNPDWIIDRYDRWSCYASEPGVVLAYASMYGNTKRMAEMVARGLVEGSIKEIRMYDVSRTHISYMLKDCWRYQGIILGSVTYDMNPLITMKHLTDLLEAKQLKNRTLGIFGSYGWSGGGVKYLRGFAERTGWELVEPVVEAERRPSMDILEQCRQLGRNMAAQISDNEH